MADAAHTNVPPANKAEAFNVANADGGTVPKGNSGRPMSKDEFMQLNSRMDVEYRLPVTANRNAKWWYSAFHNTTAIVGAGVLGLPAAMAALGWAGGIVTLILSWVISLYTLHQLSALHEYEGKRFNRYSELGRYAGVNWIVQPCQLIVMIGLGIVYTITGGTSLYRFWGYTCAKTAAGNCETAFGLSAWIVVFGAIQLFLIQCPDFNSLSVISFVAAVMSLLYSSIGIWGSVANGQAADVQYNLDGLSKPAGIFGAFNALGVIAFAYGGTYSSSPIPGHNVILEIQSTLPSPPATYRPFMRGVYVAYAALTYCYAGMAVAGYWAFGKAVNENILFSINRPVWMICVALFAVFLHVIGSYQVYTMPVLDMIEMQMVKRGINNGLIARLIYRSIYVCLTTFIACTIPFFGDLMGFIGAIGTGPTTFWVPSVIWLIIKKPSWKNWNFWASWISIVLGVLVTILGATGGLRGIITRASSYKFYQ